MGSFPKCVSRNGGSHLGLPGHPGQPAWQAATNGDSPSQPIWDQLRKSELLTFIYCHSRGLAWLISEFPGVNHSPQLLTGLLSFSALTHQVVFNDASERSSRSLYFYGRRKVKQDKTRLIHKSDVHDSSNDWHLMEILYLFIKHFPDRNFKAIFSSCVCFFSPGK